VLIIEFCFLSIYSSEKSFQRCINQGGLRFSSDWVNKVVKETEKAMKMGCKSKNELVVRIGKLQLEREVSHPIVSSFEEDCHETQLVKRISGLYFDLKMRAVANNENIMRQNGTTIRQKFRKLIQFNNV